LFVQEGTLANNKRTFRSSAKNEASSEILTLAQKIESLDVVEVDKGVLNTLCGNRPHQGFVLRCGGLEFEPLRGSSSLPSASLAGKDGPLVWLALDEVVDPQNLGALLRSAYFLGGRVGILVCSKNSSPLTTTVSAASAGALEFMTVYSTSNLPKMLNRAREDGWRVLGAAADIPDSGGAARSETGKPTILVLGSEGRGLRTWVARSCSGFVKVPGGLNMAASDNDEDATQAGVDSLNVSVTGGILLWHFLSNQ
ncbi:ribose methyltransferase, partial [Thalassiosira pseudonana CCMP1335]